MSEKYYTIGVPMNDLPRPVTGSSFKIESNLATGGSSNGNNGATGPQSSYYNPQLGGGGGGNCGSGQSGGVRFHDCTLNGAMTNGRDGREGVR